MKRKIITLDGEKFPIDDSLVRTQLFQDAADAVFFARELEYVKAKTYDVQYPELMGRQMFPVSNEGGRGITSIVYKTYDSVGSAKLINSYAENLPRADVKGKETRIPVRSVGSSFGYDVDEIESARVAGTPIDAKKSQAVRKAVEETTDKIIWFGDAEAGLHGFFSHPNIPTGAVAGGVWSGKTPAQILDDINDIFSGVVETTNKVERADKLALPVQQYNQIFNTARSEHSDMTIAKFVVANSPYLTSLDDIVCLNELASANNPTLASDAMFVYKNDASKLQVEIPVELEFFPVQEKNLEFIIPARSRVAGLNVYYPLSISIATGI